MGVCRCGEGSQTLTPAEKLPGQCVRGAPVLGSVLCQVAQGSGPMESCGPGMNPVGSGAALERI